MSIGIERDAYRLACRVCGQRGEVVVRISEWGLVTARWTGFAAGRLLRLRPQDGTAACARCGSRETLVAGSPRHGHAAAATAGSAGSAGSAHAASGREAH